MKKTDSPRLKLKRVYSQRTNKEHSILLLPDLLSLYSELENANSETLLQK